MKPAINLPPSLFESFGTVRSEEGSSDDEMETKFPLKLHSKDHIAWEAALNAIEDETAENYLDEDYKSYLKLLQLASLDEAELVIDTPPLPRVSPDIANKFDRTQGATVLLYACMNGHQQIVQHVLEGGADVDCCDENKKVTPLMCAAAFGNLEIVKILLERQCDIDVGLNGHTTALLWAIKGNHPEVASLLLDHGASQTSLVPYSETPLHAAVICGSPELLELLLGASNVHKKADLHMGPEKITPLHLAASGNYAHAETLCEILLEHGNAEVGSLNSTNQTPLHLAAASQQPDIVKLLLNHGALVTAADDNGKTPLFYAVGDSEGTLRCLQVLIQQGNSNVNHQDIHGYTALHLAGHEGCAETAEVLLLNGADFSIRAYSGGGTALSILRRKIPDSISLLRAAFDKAVTVTNSSMSVSEGRKDTTVKVNFRYVLPSTSTLNDVCTASMNDVEPLNRRKNSRWSRITAGLLADEDDDDHKLCTRKETSKIKCLVDEEHECLLLHPVIHSFLEMKWEKARMIFFPTIFFKAMLVLLFSVYVILPYTPLARQLGEGPPITGNNITTNGTLNGTTTPTTTTTPAPPAAGRPMLRSGKPGYYKAMYGIIVAMAAIKGLMELIHVLRSPRRQLKTVHPYISIAVLLTMIFYMRPGHWSRAEDRFHQTMAALGILLAWVDIWIDMSRFPKMGLSVRVFFIVLKNFAKFILPHTCLLAGFLLAFTILFRGHPEFASVMFSLTKIIRVMAGDITIVTPNGQRNLAEFNSTYDMLPYIMLVYIYTAYVLIVAIVLGNMLIGLAANDIQSIYSSASIDKLVRQTMLLNTVESKFVRSWMPEKYIDKYINLFGPSSPNKVRVFKPFDSSDNKLSTEQKQGLLHIENGHPPKAATLNRRDSARNGRQQKDAAVEMRKANRKNIRIWKDVVSKLRPTTASSSRTSQTPTIVVRGEEEDQQMQKALMENINRLVASYLEERSTQSRKPSSGNTLTLPRFYN